MENILKESLKEKIAGYLTGAGFNEIVTNSITTLPIIMRGIIFSVK